MTAMFWEAWPLREQLITIFSGYALAMSALVFIAWWFFCPPLKPEDMAP